MFPLVKILVIIAVFSAIEACNIPVPQLGVNLSQDNRNCGQNCWINSDGRRKRDLTNGLQDALLKFDIRLTEDLANEIKDLNASEKEQFIQDLEKMNKAVQFETSAIQRSGARIDSSEEFLRKLSDKIAQDFSGKKWFNRLRSIAGEQIAKLMKEMSQPN